MKKQKFLNASMVILGIMALLFITACSAPVDSGSTSTGPSGPVPASVTGFSVSPISGDGGVNVTFVESSALDLAYTLVTAVNTDDPSDTVEIRIPRGAIAQASGGTIPLRGLRAHKTYTITAVAVSKSGVKSTEAPPIVEVIKKDIIKPTVPALLNVGFNYDTAKSLKFHWNTSKAVLNGIHKIEVTTTLSAVINHIGVGSANVGSKAAKSVSPNVGTLTITDLEGAKVSPTGSSPNKVNKVSAFYRLWDNNDNASEWQRINSVITVKVPIDSDTIKPVTALKATVGKEKITKITWTASTTKDTKVRITITDTNTERLIGTGTIASGTVTVEADTAISSETPFSKLAFLFGVGTYRITAVAIVVDGRESTPVSITATTTDTVPPSGDSTSGGSSIAVTSLLQGNAVAVFLDKQPYESDYKSATITLWSGSTEVIANKMLLEVKTPDNTYATEVKKVSINKGTLSHTFKNLDKDIWYSASVQFTDLEDNTTLLKDSIKTTAALQVISDGALKATLLIVTVGSPVTTENGYVDIKWSVADGVAQQFVVTPVKYDNSSGGTGKSEKPGSAKTLLGVETSARFGPFADGDYYEFTVKATDSFGLSKKEPKSSDRVTIVNKIPKNISVASGASAVGGAGTIIFTVGGTVSNDPNATHVRVTVKKDDGTLVDLNGSSDEGLDNPQWLAENKTFKGIVAGKYAVELTPYNQESGSYAPKPTVKDDITVTKFTSKATDPPKAKSLTFGSPLHTGFTLNWVLTDITSEKKVDGIALQKSDVSYKIYYVASTTVLADAKAVKNADGVLSEAVASETMTLTVSGKTFAGTVYVVVETINDTDSTKTAFSDVKHYAVTGAKAAPSAPTGLSFSNNLYTGFKLNWDWIVGGRKDNGVVLQKSDVKYKVYYASSAAALADFEAIKNAQGTKSEAVVAGTTELTVSSENFAGVVYAVVEAIHPDGATTAVSEVGTYDVTGAATAPAVADSPVFTSGEQKEDGFTLTWTWASGGEKDNGVALQTGDVKYKVYYASGAVAASFNNAGKIKTFAEASSSMSAGVEDIAKGASLTVTVAGKAFVSKVYVVVEAINGDNSNKVAALSTIANYAVVGAATPPAAATDLIFTSGTKAKDGFTLTWTAGALDSTTHKKDDGTALAAADVSYEVYYASGVNPALFATDEKIKTLAKAGGGTHVGVGSVGKGLSPLTLVATGKAFVGKVYVVVEAINGDGSKPSAMSMIVSYDVTGAATAPPAAKSLVFESGKNKHDGFVLAWGSDAFVGSTHKKDDGSALGSGDVSYKVYYASGATVGDASDADAIKAAAKTAASGSNKTGGVETVERSETALTVTVGSKAFVGKVYAVVEAINETDTADPKKSALLATVKSYIVDGAATKPSVPVNNTSVLKSGDSSATVNWTLPSMNLAAHKQKDGTALTEALVSFEIYYIANPSSGVPTAASVLSGGGAVGSEVDGSPVVVNASEAFTKTITWAKALTSSQKVYIVIKAINTTDVSKTAHSQMIVLTMP